LGSELRVDASAEIRPDTKRRRWWVAGLLGIPVAGLGQIYNGQARKGLLGYISFLLLMVAAAILVPTSLPPWTVLLAMLLAVLLRFLLVFEGMVAARRLGSGFTPRRYNRWPAYVGALALLYLAQLGVFWLQNTYLAQTFSIPAASLEPTILVGDQIWIDKMRYRFSDPQRRDWVIFTSLEKPDLILIKRVVGLPGDRIDMRAKRLFVNGKLQEEPYAVHEDQGLGSASLPPELLKIRDNYGLFEVPAGHYFVMGDNRDNSYDSRFFGPVPRSSIQGGGKVVRYWSADPQTGKIRWDRIGDVVR
jgi:signal peptidase I